MSPVKPTFVRCLNHILHLVPAPNVVYMHMYCICIHLKRKVAQHFYELLCLIKFPTQSSQHGYVGKSKRKYEKKSETQEKELKFQTEVVDICVQKTNIVL